MRHQRLERLDVAKSDETDPVSMSEMPGYLQVIQETQPIDMFLGREVLAAYRGPRNMICVSLYNEPAEVLQATLLAIVENVRLSVAEGVPLGRCCICVVVDGAASLNPTTRAFLQRCALMPEARDSSAASCNFFSSHRAGAIEAVLRSSASASELPVAEGAEEKIDVIVSLKQVNQGKLHSHALFFCNLCLRLQPEFCYQIDAGTVLRRDAIGALVRHFEHAPEVGALATSVAPLAPRPEDGILQLWQFMDFVTQLTVLWPAEVMSGHLGVLPGQFCAFRWAALIEPSRASKLVDDQPHDSIPLYRYLRGLVPKSAFMKVKFLAEDRIIGNEIASSFDRDWKLDFCNLSGATTDACSNFMELARQRRRWNNSTTACRLSQVPYLPVLLARRDRHHVSKMRTAAGLLWQLNLMIMQLIVPAGSIGFFLVFVDALHRWIEFRGAALPLCLLICFLAWLPLVILGTACLPQPAAKLLAIVRNTLGPTVIGLLAWIAGSVMPAEFVYVIGLPIAIMLAMGLCFFWRDRGVILTRYIEYFVFSPAINIALMAYSIWYLDDTSWGTKGLKRTSVTKMESDLKRYRTGAFAGWVGINVVLFWAGSLRPGFLVHSVNPVIEFLMFGYVLGVVGALMFFARGHSGGASGIARLSGATREFAPQWG